MNSDKLDLEQTEDCLLVVKAKEGECSPLLKATARARLRSDSRMMAELLLSADKLAVAILDNLSEKCEIVLPKDVFDKLGQYNALRQKLVRTKKGTE